MADSVSDHDTCTTLSLHALRDAGVKSFTRGSDGTYSVEFFPAEPTAPPVDKTPAEPDPELCRCHHPKFQHEAGLCLMGCDVEQCAPEEK